MVNIRIMGESEATNTARGSHSSGIFLRGEYEDGKSNIQIMYRLYLVTPNLEDVRKELNGTKNKPLLIIVTLHPMYMKDAILEHANKIK